MRKKDEFMGHEVSEITGLTKEDLTISKHDSLQSMNQFMTKIKRYGYIKISRETKGHTKRHIYNKYIFELRDI